MSEPDAQVAGEPPEEELPEYAVARDPSASIARLTELAKHADGGVRAAVVENPTAPDGLFAEAWQDPADEVRIALITHRAARVPDYAFPALANDPSTHVRAAALRKLRMPEATLLELARHPDQRVRRSAVKNPGATPDVQRACDAYEAPLKKYAFDRPTVGPCLKGTRLALADGELASATVGGAVLLPEGWAWPACRVCAAPMLLLLNVELDRVPPWVQPKSRLVLFVCEEHDEVPALVEASPGAPLPPRFWERAEGHYAALVFRPGEATRRHEPSGGLAPQKLDLARVDETLEEVGPLAGRWFVGSQGWKIGGYPSWCQSPVSLTCACGAELALVAQIPEGTTLELASKAGTFEPFAGSEIYVLACTKQCDPNAVVVVVQE